MFVGLESNMLCNSAFNLEKEQDLVYLSLQMYMSVPWKMVAASTSVLTVQAPTGVSATLGIYRRQMARNVSL